MRLFKFCDVEFELSAIFFHRTLERSRKTFLTTCFCLDFQCDGNGASSVFVQMLNDFVEDGLRIGFSHHGINGDIADKAPYDFARGRASPRFSGVRRRIAIAGWGSRSGRLILVLFCFQRVFIACGAFGRDQQRSRIQNDNVRLAKNKTEEFISFQPLSYGKEITG